MTHDQSSSSKLLVPNRPKSGTRMHDTVAKLLVRDSGTSNLDGELGSCAMGLRNTALACCKCKGNNIFFNFVVLIIV